MQERKYKVKLNSAEKIEELLQETYDQTCRQITEIQNEINKLTVSTNLADTSIEEKAKYAKAIHDYTGDKTKAIMSGILLRGILQRIWLACQLQPMVNYRVRK